MRKPLDFANVRLPLFVVGLRHSLRQPLILGGFRYVFFIRRYLCSGKQFMCKFTRSRPERKYRSEIMDGEAWEGHTKNGRLSIDSRVLHTRLWSLNQGRLVRQAIPSYIGCRVLVCQPASWLSYIFIYMTWVILWLVYWCVRLSSLSLYIYSSIMCLYGTWWPWYCNCTFQPHASRKVVVRGECTWMMQNTCWLYCSFIVFSLTCVPPGDAYTFGQNGTSSNSRYSRDANRWDPSTRTNSVCCMCVSLIPAG